MVNETNTEEALRPIKEAPMDGAFIYVRTWDCYRFKPYSPKSQEYKRGIPGRWQCSGEYGGWDNCQKPNGAFWSADHTVFDNVDARLSDALTERDNLKQELEQAQREINHWSTLAAVDGRLGDNPPLFWADEGPRLKQEVERLREALEDFDRMSLVIESAVRNQEGNGSGNHQMVVNAIRTSRAALRTGG